MRMSYALPLLGAVLLTIATAATPVFASNDFGPYGTAIDHSHMKYDELKVVMDAGGATPADTAFQARVMLESCV